MPSRIVSVLSVPAGASLTPVIVIVNVARVLPQSRVLHRVADAVGVGGSRAQRLERR